MQPLDPRLSWDPMGISENFWVTFRGPFCTHDLQWGKTGPPFRRLVLTTSNVIPSGQKSCWGGSIEALALSLCLRLLRTFFSSWQKWPLCNTLSSETLSRTWQPKRNLQHYFFFFLLAKVVSSRKTCFFSRPDFFEKKKKLVRRRSLFLVHTLLPLPLLLSSSTTITIYHKLNVRTSRFCFAANFHEQLFSRPSPNHANPRVSPADPVSRILRWIFPLDSSVNFTSSKKIHHHSLFFSPLHLAGPVGWGCCCREPPRVLQ